MRESFARSQLFCSQSAFEAFLGGFCRLTSRDLTSLLDTKAIASDHEILLVAVAVAFSC